MSTYIFQQLAKLGKAAGFLSQGLDAAKTWFRTAAQRFQTVDINALIKSDPDRLLKTNKIGPQTMGKMVMFFYDPKTKKQLPYYDRFPLIFPVDVGPGFFYGINMHYLSPYQRARLMDALYRETQKGADEKKRLQLSYQILKSSSNLAAFRPCFKKYLYSHVRSRFFVVKPEEWDMVLMLPTERFELGGKGGGHVGGHVSKQRVWAESRRRF